MHKPSYMCVFVEQIWPADTLDTASTKLHSPPQIYEPGSSWIQCKETPSATAGKSEWVWSITGDSDPSYSFFSLCIVELLDLCSYIWATKPFQIIKLIHCLPHADNCCATKNMLGWSARWSFNKYFVNWLISTFKPWWRKYSEILFKQNKKYLKVKLLQVKALHSKSDLKYRSIILLDYYGYVKATS